MNAKVKLLLQLPPNWDGYGAARIHEDIVDKALAFLAGVTMTDMPEPSFVPLSDGGIQIEWHIQDRNLEIEFPFEGEPIVYYYEDDTGAEAQGPAEEGDIWLRDCIAKIISSPSKLNPTAPERRG